MMCFMLVELYLYYVFDRAMRQYGWLRDATQRTETPCNETCNATRRNATQRYATLRQRYAARRNANATPRHANYKHIVGA